MANDDTKEVNEIKEVREVNEASNIINLFNTILKGKNELMNMIENNKIIFGSKQEPTPEELSSGIKCNICNEHFLDTTALWDHNLIYHEGAFKDTYICNVCSEEFEYQDDYQDHMNTFHIEKKQEDDAVSDDSNEEELELPQSKPRRNRFRRFFKVPKATPKYECSVCKQKFMSPAYLGNHYLEQHSTYDQNLVLDHNSHDGFPGFDILEIIGMIDIMNKNDMKNLFISFNCCPICQTKFDFYHKDNTQEIESDNECDTRIHNKRSIRERFATLNEMNLQFKCDMALFYTMKTNFDHSPIQTSCCKKHICKDCIKQHIMFSNSVKCPFCLYDHTRADWNYITVYEPSKYNKKSWLAWKKRNSHIYE